MSLSCFKKVMASPIMSLCISSADQRLFHPRKPPATFLACPVSPSLNSFSSYVMKCRLIQSFNNSSQVLAGKEDTIFFWSPSSRHARGVGFLTTFDQLTHSCAAGRLVPLVLTHRTLTSPFLLHVSLLLPKSVSSSIFPHRILPLLRPARPSSIRSTFSINSALPSFWTARQISSLGLLA